MATHELDGLIERVAHHGMQAVLSFDPSTEEWSEQAFEIVRELADEDRTFTANDLRQRAGEPPSPNALGAVIGTAARSGRIRCVGWSTNDRVAARGRPIRVWTGRMSGRVR